MTLRLLSVAWVTYLLAVIPFTSARGRGRLEAHRRSRLKLYGVLALSLLGLGGVTLLLDLLGEPFGLTPISRLPSALDLLAWSAGTYAALAAAWLSRPLLRKLRGAPIAAGSSALVPTNPREKAAFVGLALTAGVMEEYVFRGYALFCLREVTGSTPLAVTLATAGFGLGHAYQGWRAVLRTALGGAILVVPVLVTGSLLPSVIAHVAMDLTQGFWSREIVIGLGLAAPPDEADAAGAGP